MIATWLVIVYPALDMISRANADLAPTRDAMVDDLERIAIGAVGLTTRALAGAETDLELTFPQWRALLVVGNDAGGARVGEVAARVGVTLPATSRLLRRLERRGLMTLDADAADRRATRVQLTQRGQDIRAVILANRRAVLEEIVGMLGDPEELGLAVGLRRIAAELERFS
jgi:DNA-binding MarR family transcriptional regulator